VFGFISFQFPSGILVYWVTTNVWSIGQQWIVNKIVKKDKIKEELVQKGKTIDGEIELDEEEKRIIRKKIKKKRKKKR